MKKIMTENEKKLSRRYLIWCYKNAKEALDRIDRYGTQLKIDDMVLKELKKSKTFKKDAELTRKIIEFEKYIEQKKSNFLGKKYVDLAVGKLAPDYQYLQLRFNSIEKTIRNYFGKKELAKIDVLYEQEMTQRIITSREHS